MEALATQNFYEWTHFQHFWLAVGTKVVLAIICGGIVGLERQISNKPAGMRTNILICVGAALYTIMSVFITQHMQGAVAGTVGVIDPGRVAAQIVSGVGFLGAGMIIQSRGNVMGLTSAATVWVVAAIGMSIGLGYPLTAVLFTATVYLTLTLLNRFEVLILGKFHAYTVVIYLDRDDNRSRAKVMQIFQHGDLHVRSIEVDNEGDRGTCVVEAQYFCDQSRHVNITAAIWGVAGVQDLQTKRKTATRKKLKEAS